MQSNPPNKFIELAQLVGDAVCSKLSFQFKFARHHYESISDNLKTMIMGECTQAFNDCASSPTFQKILHRANLELLSESIAGSLTRTPAFNITTGSGFTTDGLCKVFFNALTCNLGELANDMVLGTSIFNKKTPHLLYQDNGIHYTNATKDTLKNGIDLNPLQRRKEILTVVSDALLLLASPDEKNALFEELKNEDNPFIKILRTPRGLNSIFADEKNTASYKHYVGNLEDEKESKTARKP